MCLKVTAPLWCGYSPANTEASTLPEPCVAWGSFCIRHSTSELFFSLLRDCSWIIRACNLSNVAWTERSSERSMPRLATTRTAKGELLESCCSTYSHLLLTWPTLGWKHSSRSRALDQRIHHWSLIYIHPLGRRYHPHPTLIRHIGNVSRQKPGL